MPQCPVCLDGVATLAFSCSNARCNFGLCRSCVQHAFEDGTGENSGTCLSCRAPSAAAMAEALYGRNPLRAVRDELRHEVDLQMRVESERKDKGRTFMKDSEKRADDLFNTLSEALCMKCPRCQMVFHDYEGCNALTCANQACHAKFCAVCLRDCGTNAHAHASTHGNLFSKALFEGAKQEREKGILSDFLRSIHGESFEVQELVKVRYERMYKASPRAESNNHRSRMFLAKATAELRKAVQDDRLALVHEEARKPVGLSHDDISPRNAIPREFRLRMNSCSPDSSVMSIRLEKSLKGVWIPIDLPSEEKKDEQDSVVPKVDALINITASLRCGIVAFEGCPHIFQSSPCLPRRCEGQLQDDEISIKFCKIAWNDGNLVGEVEVADVFGLSGRQIIGVNQNSRILKLQSYVGGEKDMLFDALRHFVGDGSSHRIVDSIPLPVPDTFNVLNERQRLVAHPLSLTTAREVAGPPGTGKTKTITELVRGVLECMPRHNIVVLSERNGAIDAIAEKFVSECMETDKAGSPRIKDVGLWLNVLTVGATGAMGPCTCRFTVEKKLDMHPDLVAFKKLNEDKKKKSNEMYKSVKDLLAEEIGSMGGIVPAGGNAWKQSRSIASGVHISKRATDVILTVEGAVKALDTLLRGKDPTEDQVRGVVAANSAILENLVPFQKKDEEATRNSSDLPKLGSLSLGSDSKWHSRRAGFMSALEKINVRLAALLKDPIFSLNKAKKVEFELRASEAALTAAQERIKKELLNRARVRMATIGSYHKMLPDQDTSSDDESLRDTGDDLRDTIVVFDEAGCIPSYELLGLTRLPCNIVALVCVGDKHQLAPYTANQFFKSPIKGNGGHGRFHNYTQSRSSDSDSVTSILDASALTTDHDNKIKLNQQYRVPYDIAEILNVRVYNGEYATAAECAAATSGFRFVHVDRPMDDRRDRERKYINNAEVNRCSELILELREEASAQNMMVLTPYKKQQRQLQFALKKLGFEETKVLTIDQCQGQEADCVILSLVQRPTRFLNKNRFNVALSRTRKRLFMLADRSEFKAASHNDSWECHWIARDLLRLDAEQNALHADNVY